jgi:hypothetical protein
MAELYHFPVLTLGPHPMASVEGVLVKAISVVQGSMPPDSGVSPEQLLDELLEVLDGPEAIEVYNRLKQTY